MDKKRTLVTVLGVGALVGLVGTSSAQFISLDGSTEPITVRAKTNDVVLTADFVDATLSDVTAWMNKSNLNYAVDSQALKSDRRASLHFRNSTGHEVLQAVAAAYGLEGNENNNVFVLRTPSLIQAAPMPMVAQSVPSAPSIAEAPEAPEAAAPVAEPDHAAQKAAEAAAKEAEAAAKEAEAATDLATAKAAARKAASAARKAAELARRSGAFAFSFDSKDFKDFAEMGKTFPKFKAFKMDPKAMEEMHKAFGEAFKGHSFAMDPESLKKLEQEMKRAFDGKEFKFDMKGFADAEKAHAEALKHFKGDGKNFLFIAPNGEKMGKGKWMLNGKMADLKGVLDSLTDVQKGLMKSRGYLKLSDLTQKQKELLGNPSGSFHFSISMDGQKLVIKGDEHTETIPPTTESI